MRGATITVIAQSANFLIQTIGTLILARLLTPVDFGLVTMVLTFSLLLGNFGLNGFTEAIIQKDELHHNQISTLFWINASIAVILAAIFIACSFAVVWFYKEPRLNPIIIALACSNVISGLSVQHLALLKRSMHFFKLCANDLIASILSIAFSILLAWYNWGYWSLVAKWVTLPLSTTIGAWILCSWRPGIFARGTGVRVMLRFAFHTYGNFIMNYFRRNLDKMLIGRLFGTQPLGCYDRAYHLSSMLPTQIINPIYSVAVATFSRLSHDHEQFRKTYLKVLSILAFLGMPLGAVMTLISDDIVLLLLGPQWKEAGPMLFAFSLSIGIMIIYITHGWLHLSLGTPNRWFRWSIVEFFVTVVCLSVGLTFGPLGVAGALSVSFYILVGPALWYAGKPLKLSFYSILSCLWKYYVAALAAGLSCWLFLHSYGPHIYHISNLNIIIRIITSFILCAFSYLVFLVSLYRSTTPISQFVVLLREIVMSRASNS